MLKPVVYRFNRGSPVYPGDLAVIDGRRIKPAKPGDPGAFTVPEDAFIEASCIAWAPKQ